MSFFNRPAWAAQPHDSEGEDEEPQNIFSHSSRTIGALVAEKERKKQQKQEKLDKKKVKLERRSSSKRTRDEARKERDGAEKKRRLSHEESDEERDTRDREPEYSFSNSARGRELEGIRYDEEEEQLAVASPPRRSPRTNRREMFEMSPMKPWKQNDVVELGGSSDNEANIPFKPIQKPKVVEPLEDEDSDEELAALARQARARRLQQQTEHSASPAIAAISPSPGLQRESSNPGLPTPPLPDPVVQLFVSSQIPNTKPILVFRKLSQRLQEIRTIWCEKQGFAPDFTRGVFFIHRMRRVYDATTCRSLGLEVDAEGKVVMKGGEGQEGVEKVHIEAVTEEIFATLKIEKAREDLRRSGGLGPEDDPDAETGAGAADDQPEKEEELIRLILRAKGKADFKLKVKPTTVFSKIVGACRRQFKLADDVSCFLEFDGDRLEDDDQVQSTEISDMDVVDVHV